MISETAKIEDGSNLAAALAQKFKEEKMQAAIQFAEQMIEGYHQRLQYSTSALVKVWRFDLNLKDLACKYCDNEEVRVAAIDLLEKRNWHLHFEGRGTHEHVVIVPIESGKIPAVMQQPTPSKSLWRQLLAFGLIT